MAKILIIGGTGFVGYYVIRALSEAGFELGVLLHKRKDDFDIPYDGYKTFEGDILKPTTLEKVMSEFKPDVVIHLVGIIREIPPRATYKKIHVQGTQNIAEAAKKTGVKKIIYVSALGADLEGITEYYKSKAQAEEIIKNTGLDYTILRPELMFGWRSQFTNRLKFWAKLLPFIPVIEKKDIKLQPVAAETLASIVAQASQSKGSRSTYEVVGPEAISVYEITKRIKEKMGSGKTILPIPIFIARIAAAWGSLHLPTPITKTELKMLLLGHGGSNEKLKADFEFEDIYFDPMGEYPIY